MLPENAESDTRGLEAAKATNGRLISREEDARWGADLKWALRDFDNVAVLHVHRIRRLSRESRPQVH